jgi:hypothetical protein
MDERQRNKTSTAVSRASGGRFSVAWGRGRTRQRTLAALAPAWTVTTIATALFLVALAIAPIWDGAIFVQALRDALSGDPQLMMQPIDEAPADTPADRESPRAPKPADGPYQARRVSYRSTGFLLARPQLGHVRCG